MDTQRVIVAQPSPIFRETVRQVLACNPTLQVVAEVSTGAEALAGVLQLQPDIAILDVHLPDRNGIELARELRARTPRTQVILLLSDGADAYRLAATRHGATCAAKDRLVEELPGALASCGTDLLVPPPLTTVAPCEQAVPEEEGYTCLGMSLPRSAPGKRILNPTRHSGLADALRAAAAIFLIGTLFLAGTAWLGMRTQSSSTISRASAAVIDEPGILGEPGAIVRLDPAGRDAYEEALAAKRQAELATCIGIAFLVLVVGSLAVGCYEARQRTHLDSRREEATSIPGSRLTAAGRGGA